MTWSNLTHFRKFDSTFNNNNIPSIILQVGFGDDRVYADLITSNISWEVETLFPKTLGSILTPLSLLGNEKE